MGIRKAIGMIIVLVVIILAIINGMRIFPMRKNMHPIDSDQASVSANMGDKVQGEYIVYSKKNTIMDFPFCFGDRLVLYDYQKDQKSSISCKIMPFAYEGEWTIFFGNDIFMGATGEDISDAIHWYHISLDTGIREKIEQIDIPYAYFSYKDDIYYVIGQMDDEEPSEVYRMHPETKKKELFLEDYISCINIYDEMLYWANPKNSTIITMNMKNGKRREYHDGYDDAQIIRRIDDKRFAVFYESGRIRIFIEGNPIDCGEFDTSFFQGNPVGHKNEYLYFCSQKGIQKLNVKTREVSAAFELSQIDYLKGDRDYPDYEASFSDEYIFIEIDKGRNQWLCIVDYQGNVVCIKKK